MERLFTYGTLQDPEVQKQVFGRVADMHSDALKGYRKSVIKLKGKVYPIAVYDASSLIEGMTLEATQEEILMMDKYETSAYKRIEVTLASGQRAWVYCRP
ncbi:MAG TPA: gamma-glutamylcyclotransferase family protein [Candidatus Saccharimonadales bacterium]|nr:gamma-glutamylcyclotransferase family protein [Candidatus Saccharimonadales bacterium]